MTYKAVSQSEAEAAVRTLTTSALPGVMRDNHRAREAFLRLARPK